MNYMPITKCQLRSILDKQVVTEVAKETEKSSFLALQTEGRRAKKIPQSKGLCLAIIVSDYNKPKSPSFHMDAQSDIERAQPMLVYSNGFNNIEKAISSGSNKTIRSQIVITMYKGGISPKKQVECHQEIVETNVAGALLVVPRSCPDRLLISDLFLGDRIDLGAMS